MWQFLVKRAVLLVVTLLGICVLSFLVMTQSPGDPTASMLGLQNEGKRGRIQSLDLVIEAARKALYLDRPAIINTSPNSRRKVARDLAADLIGGTQQKRAAAQDELKGEVGTAALSELVALAPGEADKAAFETASLHELAARLDAVADKTPADVFAAVEPLETRFGGKGPRFSKRASLADRAHGWAAFVREREADRANGIAAFLDALDTLVPAADGGPATRGFPPERARAWTDWWAKNSSRYSDEAAEKAVASYMSANDAERPARLDELRRLGGVAVPAVMSAYHGSRGGEQSRAAFALSVVAHKPWDLTKKPEQAQAYRHEWQAKKEKLDRDRAAKLIEESVYNDRVAELGAADAYIEKATASEFADQKRSIARWWFRSEESFVSFSFPRQMCRAFTQTQFGNWFRSLLLGFDFGKSYTFKKDVSQLIKERLPVTLWINFFSLFLTYVIAIPIGIYSATHPRTITDRVTTIVLFVLYSLPPFWVGSICILLLTGPPQLNWFPAHGISSMGSENLSWWGWFVDVSWHLTLPIVCLTYGGIAYISRFMRGGMLEVVRQDYIRTARAKGLSEKVVIFKHALRNSLIPILTLLAYLLPNMFGGSIIIESIFSIDGLGKLMFEAIIARDYPVIMSDVFISGFLTLVGILLADISYAIVDPRIELK